MDRETVEKVAALAALRLTEAEKEMLARELTRIVDYMARVSAVPVENVEPLVQPGRETAPLREDEAHSHPDPASLLALAAERQGPFYRVPHVLARESSGDSPPGEAGR